MVILDPEDIPDFSNLKDDDMAEMLQKMFSDFVEKLTKSELFKDRCLGLMDEIKEYCKFNKILIVKKFSHLTTRYGITMKIF